MGGRKRTTRGLTCTNTLWLAPRRLAACNATVSRAAGRSNLVQRTDQPRYQYDQPDACPQNQSKYGTRGISHPRSGRGSAGVHVRHANLHPATRCNRIDRRGADNYSPVHYCNSRMQVTAFLGPSSLQPFLGPARWQPTWQARCCAPTSPVRCSLCCSARHRSCSALCHSNSRCPHGLRSSGTRQRPTTR